MAPKKKQAIVQEWNECSKCGIIINKEDLTCHMNDCKIVLKHGYIHHKIFYTNISTVTKGENVQRILALQGCFECTDWDVLLDASENVDEVVW